MDKKFGRLLKQWRKNHNGLTQASLGEELGVALDRDPYSKSTISKWENRNIPDENVIEKLEEILGCEPGLLMNAAGLSKESKERLSIERQQMQHETELRNLAQAAYDSLPKEPDKYSRLFEVQSAQIAIYNAYKMLMGSPSWPSLSFHLGADTFKKFDEMILRIQPLPTTNDLNFYELDKREYKDLIQESWILIFTTLSPLVQFGSSKQMCKWCPAFDLSHKKTHRKVLKNDQAKLV